MLPTPTSDTFLAANSARRGGGSAQEAPDPLGRFDPILLGPGVTTSSLGAFLPVAACVFVPSAIVREGQTGRSMFFFFLGSLEGW